VLHSRVAVRRGSHSSTVVKMTNSDRYDGITTGVIVGIDIGMTGTGK